MLILQSSVSAKRQFEKLSLRGQSLHSTGTLGSMPELYKLQLGATLP